MEACYYSVRMHADRDGCHVSGAERLVAPERVDNTVAAMLQRAMSQQSTSTQISIDKVVPVEIVRGPMPNLTEVPVGDFRSGREKALQALVAAGVAAEVAMAAIDAIADGAGPARSNMRGAMLIDARNGDRLEPVSARGVRATRMDVEPGLEEALSGQLIRQGLPHHRTREALILAAKVMAAPGIIAELCWSDDPEYTAGYVCAPGFGYLRIPHLKASGDPHGGRSFFFMPGFKLTETIRFLEETPFLVNRLGLVGNSAGK